jgi:SAM-dependent methyltransferase/uncharacterized protein YbaR (Trm112 family)
MQESLIELLRCPVTRSELTVTILKKAKKILGGQEVEVIEEGILFASKNWFYPIIKCIPRLNVEALIDHADFLQIALPDYEERKKKILFEYSGLLKIVEKKNRRTKKSFSQEWKLYNYTEDKTWDANREEMLDRFLKETDETLESLKNKIIFDAGCGNGTLNSILAEKGVVNIAMDFSNSVEKAYEKNNFSKVYFIQGDVQFPPVLFNYFDIVHSSGVLIHTNNTELSFSCIEPAVKKGGKLSVWLYHHRKDFIHNLFNAIRKVTSKLPLKVQYYLYCITIFPVSFIIKRLKGNKQNVREMMIDILDWFSPEFRWEHNHEEVIGWYKKRNYSKIKITTTNVFGFNTTGVKN